MDGGMVAEHQTGCVVRVSGRERNLLAFVAYRPTALLPQCCLGDDFGAADELATSAG